MDQTPEGDWYVIEDEQGGRKLMKGNL
jgi:hypothetical protein